MPKCIILQGIPCSGKSTWAYQQQGYVILSCDRIRLQMFGEKYKFSDSKEVMVWQKFYQTIETLAKAKVNIIIDNTNIRPVYIDRIKELLSSDYDIEIKKFDILLWKAYLRNYIRYIKTGKWIPIKVIKNFYKRYKQLN